MIIFLSSYTFLSGLAEHFFQICEYEEGIWRSSPA